MIAERPNGGTFPETILGNVINEISDESTVGVLLTGSRTRGRVTKYSDIDLLKFTERLPENQYDRYKLL